MFPIIETIIKDGQFSGCNINIQTTTSNSLSAVITFLSPVNVNEIHLMNSTSNKEQLDNIYTLRSYLAKPLVVMDAGNGLDAAIVEALSNIRESMVAGAKTLVAIDMAGLIKEATDKVTSQAKTKEVKKEAVKKSAKQPSKVVADEALPAEPENKWEADLQSL